MPTIIICRGIPGIGKSTYAKKLIESRPFFLRYSKDDMRSMQASEYKNASGDVVDDTMHAYIESCIQHGKSIVLDNTFCVLKHLDDIIYRYNSYIDITIVEFPNDVPKALEQNKLREGDACLQDKVILNFSKEFTKSSKVLAKRGYEILEGYVENTPIQIYKIPKKVIVEHKPHPRKHKVIVWDIDNTLSTLGDRGVYDFEKCGLDNVIESTTALFRIVDNYNYEQEHVHTKYEQIFITGRGEECRKETLQWLQDNVGEEIKSTQLYMRPFKDFRRDSVVKEEIYLKQINPSKNIVMWFDDSPKVRKEFLIPYKIPFVDTTNVQYIKR